MKKVIHELFQFKLFLARSAFHNMEVLTPRPVRKSVKRKYQYDDTEKEKIPETQLVKVRFDCKYIYIYIYI